MNYKEVFDPFARASTHESTCRKHSSMFASSEPVTADLFTAPIPYLPDALAGWTAGDLLDSP